jgi:arylsulfatase A-like enzyme
MLAPGVATKALVGSVDIYPTLVELCGLTAPERLDGESLRALLDDPAAPGKPQTLGFWNKRGHQGLSMRTDRYRYTEWTKGDGPAQVVELYDLREDPEGTRNLAGERPKVVGVLREQMARSRITLR